MAVLKKIKQLFGGSSKVPPRKSELEKLKENGLTVGENFNMLAGCMIDYSHCWHIKIGNDVTLAPRVIILAHDASTKMHLDHVKIKNVNIGNYVFIGAGSIIMPGVTIGSQVIIGAGSVVTKDIPDNSVFAGNPSKFICKTDEYLKSQEALMTKTNTFDSSFTLGEHLSDSMKQKMIETIQKEGIAFVF